MPTTKPTPRRDRLTLAKIQSFPHPATGQVFLRDTVSPHLAVRVTPASKTYVFESTLDYKLIRIVLGDVREWPLESVWSGSGNDRTEEQRGARQEAARLQMLVDQGIDPRVHAREEQAAQEAAKEAQKAAEAEAAREVEAKAKHTLITLLEAYVEHLEGRGKNKSAAAARTMFKNHVLGPFPQVAAKPAREVTALEIATIIRKVTEKGKERTAGALRSYLSAAFNAAAKAPFDPRLPSALIPFAVEANPVAPVAAIKTKARDRTLTPKELEAYLKALGDGLDDQALRLSLYAGGQRIAQLLRARVSDWNPESRILRLFDPKGRRTEPREHLLPVGPKAAAMVNTLMKRAEGRETEWLFHQRGRRMDPGTPGKRIATIITETGADHFTVADVRRTCETLLAGMKVSRDVRAHLLSHGLSGVQHAHYDKHDYIDEKHRALVRWERKLEGMLKGDTGGSTVTPIRRARA